VLRGGSFNNNQNNARVAYRNNNNPNNDNNNYGLRLVFAPITFFPFRERTCLPVRPLPKVAGVYGFQLAAKAEG